MHSECSEQIPNMKIKNIFKNTPQMNTDNTDKEPIENAAENAANEIETAEELSVEAQLQEELAKEKDKFLRLWKELFTHPARWSNWRETCL